MLAFIVIGLMIPAFLVLAWKFLSYVLPTERDHVAIRMALTISGAVAILIFVSGFAIGVSAILIFVIVALSLFSVPSVAFFDRR